MKDERSPSLTDATVTPEPTSDELRVILGERVRTARQTEGMSQQGLADAMRTQGFNWRQTTVAKVEGADRPTLFVEVVALSRIFRRPIDYFFSARDQLDDLTEELLQMIGRVKIEEDDARTRLELVSYRLHTLRLEEKLSRAIIEYRKTYDSGELLQSVANLSHDYYFGDSLSRVLNAAGVSGVEQTSASYAAAQEVAWVELLEISEVNKRELDDVEAEELERRRGKAETVAKDVGRLDQEYLREIHHRKEWGSIMSHMIVDLIIEHST